MSRLLPFGLAALAMLLLPGTAHAWYWCEPAQAYYPWVRSCPEPWRQVDPRAAARQPGGAPPSAASTPQPAPAQPAPAQQAAAAQGGAPTFTPATSLTRGDALDAWCKGSTTAINIAVCGDNDLRALAIERLHAFDDASVRASADQRKALTGDQNGWAMSYPQACGIHANEQPPQPLPPSVKECLMRAGRTRLDYLRAYATPAAANGNAATNAPAPATPANPPATPSPQPAAESSTAAAPPAEPQPAAPTQSAAAPTDTTQQPAANPALPLPQPDHPAAPAKPVTANPTPVSRSSIWDMLMVGIRAVAIFLTMLVVGLWVWITLKPKPDARTSPEPPPAGLP